MRNSFDAREEKRGLINGTAGYSESNTAGGSANGAAEEVDQVRVLAAEFLGVFFLVFIALGSVYTSSLVTLDVVTVDRMLLFSLAYGLAYAAAVYGFSFTSTDKRVPPNMRHLNPAVTLGLFLSFKLTVRQLILYVLSQLAGAGLAVFLLFYIAPIDKRTVTTAFMLGDGVTPSMMWMMEIIISYISVLVILMTSFGHMAPVKKNNAPTSILDAEHDEEAPQTHHEINCIISGGVILVCSVVGAPVSGGFMNPLLAVGVSILSGIDYTAPYLAPLFASLLAVITGVIFGFKVPLVAWLKERAARE